MQNWKDRYEAKLTKPWMKKYFSYRGRLNRKPYILRSLVLFLIFNLFLSLVIETLARALPSGGIVFNIFSAVLGLVYQVASFSLIARRLHDIDNGAESFIKLSLGVGIGIFVIGLVCLLLSLLPIPFIRVIMGGIITFVIGAGWIFGLYILFVLICLLFRKGTTGPNRFGEDPLQHVGVTPNP